MNNVRNDKEALLRKVMEYDFVLTDTGMYLDTHPDDYNALEYFRNMSALAKSATVEYENKYGTLTTDSSVASGDRWNWIECQKIWEA